MRVQSIQSREKQLFNTGEKLVLAVLLFAFMDFYQYSLHLMVMGFAVFFMMHGRVRVVNGVIPPLLLTAVLCIFWPAELFSPTALAKRLVWPAAFLLGYNLILPVGTDECTGEKAGKKVNVCIMVAVVGFLIHVVLNIGMNWNSGSTSRDTLDFWSGAKRAATGQAALFCVPLAWSVTGLIKETGFTRRLPAITALVVMLYYNLSLGGRTPIYSLVIILAVALLFLLKHQGMEKKKENTVLAIVLLSIVAILLYHFDVWGLRSLIEESALFARMFGDDRKKAAADIRWERKLKYLRHMLDYPWGGNNLLRVVGGYAHDVLLDTYDETSVFGFLAVVAMLWDGVSKLLRALRSRVLHFDTRLLLLCSYISVFIIFAVEPVFAGMPWVLMVFCFFHGMVTALTGCDSLTGGDPQEC